MNQPLPLLITGVRVLDPAVRREQVTDLFVAADGQLQPVPVALPDNTYRIDGRRLVAAPGFWDLHVHFRDPGNPAAETMASGAAAAAAGGFTHVVTMPNTSPACDTAAFVRHQQDPALSVRILPSACVTSARQGAVVADLEALADAGAVAFTDDGAMVADDTVMAGAMRRARALGRVIMDHAVAPSIAGSGVIRDCALAHQLGLPLFPAAAEIVAVERDIKLCRETGCAVHIQHISCAGTINALRAAQQAGLPVTGEASPHHLAIATEDIPGDDGNFRMNPPLGTRTDMAALRQAVCDGTISCFATDHAPHTSETKTQGLRRSAAGVIGLETAIGVTYTVMVERAGLSLLDWVARWTTGPATVLGLTIPTMAMGTHADLVLLDLQTPWRVDTSTFMSRSRNCPFTGWTLRGRAMLTVCAGRVTHHVI